MSAFLDSKEPLHYHALIQWRERKWTQIKCFILENHGTFLLEDCKIPKKNINHDMLYKTFYMKMNDKIIEGSGPISPTLTKQLWKLECMLTYGVMLLQYSFLHM